MFQILSIIHKYFIKVGKMHTVITKISPNYIMNNFIVLLNILLLALILYYLIGKSNSIIENLAGCPSNKRNLIYANEANLNRLFSEINTLKVKVDELSPKVTKNSKSTKRNKTAIKGAVNNATKAMDDKEKEGDKIGTGTDPTPGEKKGLVAAGFF